MKIALISIICLTVIFSFLIGFVGGWFAKPNESYKWTGQIYYEIVGNDNDDFYLWTDVNQKVIWFEDLDINLDNTEIIIGTLGSENWGDDSAQLENTKKYEYSFFNQAAIFFYDEELYYVLYPFLHLLIDSKENFYKPNYVITNDN